jgi:hypothetical protein
MKLFIMQFSLSSCYVLPLRSRMFTNILVLHK